jgi:pyruvate formate lyase activating enzyme
MHPPVAPSGVPCGGCVNECRIPYGETGYCGLKKNLGGTLSGVSPARGKLSWYHDPLPTNCVGDWVCAGGTGAGYPRFAFCNGPERGYKNLAVFFHACSFNCLYCQNWQFKQQTHLPQTTDVYSLIAAVDAKTTCICYFGGDPSPQAAFSIHAARLALKKTKDALLRICWETNGSMHPQRLDEMVEIALFSGGCIKFDLKAFDDRLHEGLTGVSNRFTLENFRRAGKWIPKRPVPPLVIASTLLVPGYIDAEEIEALAAFIASVNPEIPYALLAFHPQFFMSDLSTTSRRLAYQCEAAARRSGLKNVRIGNRHLLC